MLKYDRHLLLDITRESAYADWWTLAASKRCCTGSRADTITAASYRSAAVSATVSGNDVVPSRQAKTAF